MTVLEVLKKNRPNIGFNTIKTYDSRLRNFFERHGLSSNPENVIRNIQKILGYIKVLPSNVKGPILTALIVYLDSDNGDKQLISDLRELLLNNKYEFEEERPIGSMTATQKEGWIPFDELMQKYDALGNEISDYFRTGAIDLTKEQYKKCELYVILSCYLLIPPRRSMDFTHFKIRNFNPEDKDCNYMENGKNARFVFNVYKTAKFYGTQYVNIPNKLRDIIRKWMSINKYDWLITTESGTPIASPRLNAILHAYFKQRTSTSIFRHSYVTYKTKKGELNTHTKRKKLARDMGHSIEQQQEEYLKD